jgi:hypothetical protein
MVKKDDLMSEVINILTVNEDTLTYIAQNVSSGVLNNSSMTALDTAMS